MKLLCKKIGRVGVAAGLIWVATAVAACDSNDPGPAKEGELGVGNFIYRCVGDSDPFCDEGGSAEVFPEAIAVGGRFNLDYNQDRDGALPNVIPGSDSVEIDGPSLRLVRAGFAVVLASEGFGDVIDLLHLTGRDVVRISVSAEGSQDLSTLELEVGERITLRAQPEDANRTTLAGALDYTWASDDDAVFAVATADQDESVEIEAMAPGSTILRVTAGGFTQSFEVEVAGDTGTTGSPGDSGSSTGEGSTGLESSTGLGGSGSDGLGGSGSTGGSGGSGGSSGSGSSTGGA